MRKSWQIGYTSPSLAGTIAAVKAGLGVTVLPANMVPTGLMPLAGKKKLQHFKSLLFKATQIQQEIEKEQSRRLPDWVRLLKLKKLRLKIKDKLCQFAQKSAGSASHRSMKPVFVRKNNKSKYK